MKRDNVEMTTVNRNRTITVAPLAGAIASGTCAFHGDESCGVCVSPYLRTVQTKDYIVERIGRNPTFDYQDPCLREQDCGNLPEDV